MCDCGDGARPSPDPRKQGTCVRCLRSLPAGWRNSDFERDFLDGAERRARSMGIGYTEKVRDRLTRAERQYGVASYLDKGLRGCLRETDEEALDLAGWPVLAALIANDEISDYETRCYFVDRLQHLAALGAEAHQVVKELEGLLA